MAVAQPTNINANLVRQYWDTKLEKQQMFRDIYSRYRSVFDRVSNIAIPKDALTLEINAEANNSYRTARIGWKYALSGTWRQGDQQPQIGFEEGRRQLTQDVYFNEYSHAVTAYEYGIHQHDEKAYGLNMEDATVALGDYMEELNGYFVRQSLLQRRSSPLTASPVNQAQLWNPRWYIKNVATQPAYSTVLQTHTNNIASALLAGGIGDASTLDANYLSALHYYITTERIEPLMLNGKPGYILTVPTRQKFHAFRLDKDNSLAEYWTSVNRMSDEDKANFPDLLGKWLNIYLVEDERSPTVTVGGTAAPFTVTPSYVLPGANDQRNLTNSGNTWDIGVLHGRAPIIDFYPVKLHHEYDDYNYKKWIGKGAFCMRGHNLRMYDNTTQTATSWEQRYSVICAFGRGTVNN